MNQCNPVRRLPLQGAPNTRDLGGYPCDSGFTRWGQFLRSAGLAALTEQDIAELRDFGLTTVVDLRSAYECQSMPSKLEGHADFEVFNVPLLDQMNSSGFEGDLPGSMSGLYISLLDKNQAEMVEIFTRLANAKGAALFHCTAGKDRTGVVAMLLLNLAGVQDSDIIADYSVTEIYMRNVFSSQLEGHTEEIPEYVFRSIPQSMVRVLQHLKETFGNAEQFLQTAGLAQEKIDILKEKMMMPS